MCRATDRACVSVPKACADPRKMLRGTWSNRMQSARAPLGRPSSHPSSLRPQRHRGGLADGAPIRRSPAMLRTNGGGLLDQARIPGLRLICSSAMSAFRDNISCRFVETGAVGYVHQQLTQDRGQGAVLGANELRTRGLGPRSAATSMSAVSRSTRPARLHRVRLISQAPGPRGFRYGQHSPHGAAHFTFVVRIGVTLRGRRDGFVDRQRALAKRLVDGRVFEQGCRQHGHRACA